MENQKFYTIQRENGTFIPSNLFINHTMHIIDAIKFYTLEDVIEYKKDLRKDKIFKIIEVNCSFKEVEEK
ncbi:hypothetical protein EXM58_13800 [Clostridium botulinum]|nr:hypothetical protein N487_09770 [Clostridium botulinum B2 331]KEI92251.1 hypothetical protein N491_10375 [Clostridium botulinum B2 275]NEZ96958.1 hypothetical protein [Clostridium botulinum]NFA10642.1 hypothetical protein [Clostridium botulinum]NFA26113.1 hypothetical protein [Clostridium botulinum]